MAGTIDRRSQRQAERQAKRVRGNATRQPAGLSPLDPHLFSFHGFGDLTSSAEEKIRGVGIRGGEPEVAIVEGGVFVPAVNVWDAGHGGGQLSFAGGVVTADGQPVDAAHLRRGRQKLRGGLDEPVTVAPEREADDEVVYLGWLFDHFGRFLLDSLARAWFLDDVDPSARVAFHYPPPSRSLSRGWEARIPEWQLRILDAFGVPRHRILVPEVPTRFRRLIVPEALFVQGNSAHPEMVRPFRQVASRFVDGAKRSAQPVYLSRRLLSSRRRPIVGEAELEDVLRENGVLVVHPETMTFADQVRLVNAHTDILSNVGSAAHNVLFALGKPTLHLLANGDRIPRNFFLCSALADAPTAFINCLSTRDRPPFGGAQATPVFAETSTLADYLEERGLLKTRLRASLAGRSNPALRQQYDEAWFYARVRSAITDDEPLPPALEDEATGLARSSWPVSAILALYYTDVEPAASRAVAMAERFAELAAAEHDVNRLMHYRAEVDGIAQSVAAVCDPPLTARLAAVLADRFVLTP